jgi:hypothetical protein
MTKARDLSQVPNASLGFKNRIINGAMQVWQRGTSISVSGSDTYTADRWVGIAAGANYTASQASYTDSVDGVTKNSLVISGAAGNTLCDIAQRIESVNAYDLAGSICTVSATLYTTDGTNITWEAYSANSANVFSSKTLIATGTLTTVASTYVARTFSFTSSSAVANGLEIRFKFGALLSGKQGALGSVQLEKGSTATSFDYRSFGTEVALCQRYFCKTYNIETPPATTSTYAGNIRTSVQATNSYTGFGHWSFPVSMRATPTMTVYNPQNGVVNGFVGDGVNYSPASPFNPGTSGCSFYVNNVSIGTSVFIHIHATAVSEL